MPTTSINYVAAIVLAFVASLAHADFKVVKVVDGDTIHVMDADKGTSRVRLHGIDTPERRQPYYRKATDALAAMVAGRQVTLVYQDTDRYGRIVATVLLPDGTNVNLRMVEQGWAWWYQRYAPEDKALQTAQQRAREGRLGLWADENPVAPWDWRRR